MKKYTFLIVLLAFGLDSQVFAQSQTDSLKLILRSLDTTKTEELQESINTLNLLSYNYLYTHPDSSLWYAHQALKKATDIDYKLGMATSYHRLSYHYTQHSKADSALVYGHESLKVFEAIDDTLGIINATNDIALAHLLSQNYELGLEIYIELLPLVYEFEGESFNVAKIKANIGYIQWRIGEYSKGIESYKEAIESAQMTNNKAAEAIYWANLGGVYIKANELENAQEAYQQSLNLSESIGDKTGVGVAQYNLGKIHRLKGELELSEQRTMASFPPLLEMQDERLLSHAHIELGQLYTQKGEFDKALISFNNAHELILSITNPELLMDVLKLRSQLYMQVGDYELALENHIKYDSVRNSYLEENQASKILSLNQQFDLANQDLKIELLEQQRELQASRLEKEELWRKFLILGGIFSLVIMGLLGRSYWVKKNSELQLQQKNKRLEELNEEKNVFMRMAAHDLKNPLAAISGLAELIQIDVNESEYEEVPDYTNKILLVTTRMLEIIKNLLNVEAIEAGEKIIRPKPIHVDPLITRTIDDYKIQAENKDISIHYKTDNKEMYVLADESAMDGILDNLLSNAIKYSEAHKNVWIHAYPHNSTNCIEISDEGLGLTEEDKEQMFKKYKTLSSKPTGGEHSNGLGLYIVQNLIKQLNGSITCESEKGKGTKFIVVLPSA